MYSINFMHACVWIEADQKINKKILLRRDFMMKLKEEVGESSLPRMLSVIITEVKEVEVSC